MMKYWFLKIVFCIAFVMSGTLFGMKDNNPSYITNRILFDTIEKDDCNFLQQLIDQNVSLKCVNDNGLNPLMFALKNKSNNCLKLLLEIVSLNSINNVLIEAICNFDNESFITLFTMSNTHIKELLQIKNNVGVKAVCIVLENYNFYKKMLLGADTITPIFKNQRNQKLITESVYYQCILGFLTDILKRFNCYREHWVQEDQDLENKYQITKSF